MRSGPFSSASSNQKRQKLIKNGQTVCTNALTVQCIWRSCEHCSKNKNQKFIPAIQGHAGPEMLTLQDQNFLAYLFHMDTPLYLFR